MYNETFYAANILLFIILIYSDRQQPTPLICLIYYVRADVDSSGESGNISLRKKKMFK